MKKKERIIFLDLLRVTAIFCVMMIHALTSQFDEAEVAGVNWNILNIYDSLCRFCVPVLVMISGVFFLDAKREYSIQKLLKQNVLRLVTAYFFWAFSYAFFDAFLDYKTISAQFIKSVIQNTFTGKYHLWFVSMMIGLYLFVPILRKIAESETLVRYFILLSFLFCYVGNFIILIPEIGETAKIVLDKMSVTMAGGYTGYFFAGYYFYHFKIDKKTEHLIYALGAVSVCTTIAATYFLSKKAGALDSSFYNYLFVTTCFYAWAVFLFFKNKMSKIKFSEKMQAVIARLSELSFGMYLVHIFINAVCKKIGFTTTLFTPVLSVLIITAVVFAASFLISVVLWRIPFARKYLM